ncbi:MAG TPA: hypothetical protein PKY86_04030 [Niabella sp.]|nr:hypothetical protein [Niabella sp.]
MHLIAHYELGNYSLLEKSEKRNLKLFVSRNSGAESLKSMKLFDAFDKMVEYDEALLLKKVPSVSKLQLSNTKALLYRQILSSLRVLRDDRNADLQLHEMMDNARILFNKGLYHQTLKILDRIKDFARAHSQLTYLQQALFFEKKIEALFITRSFQSRALELTRESNEVSLILENINKLSNLNLLLYSWYIQNGHARNELDLNTAQALMEKNLPHKISDSFYERVYLYQCQVWYAYIKLDFLMYYRYCQKWVDAFDQNPKMIETETAMYVKGMHNLMSAHFNLLNHDKLAACIKKFKQFGQSAIVQDSDNNRIITYVYLYTAVINMHFLEGAFQKGIKMVPFLETMLVEYGRFLDRHRVMVFYYKIACLYFGSGDNGLAIDYLNRIIHQKDDLRTDLQCYSRLLHLIAHYELGNYSLLEYLIKSVYRYMAKMKNLSKVEEEIFRFLKRAFKFNEKNIKTEFEKLLNKLRKYQSNRLEARAFAYLDVISWLESKISDIKVQDVIREKYLRKRG